MLCAVREQHGGQCGCSGEAGAPLGKCEKVAEGGNTDWLRPGSKRVGELHIALFRGLGRDPQVGAGRRPAKLK